MSYTMVVSHTGRRLKCRAKLEARAAAQQLANEEQSWVNVYDERGAFRFNARPQHLCPHCKKWSDR